MNKLILLCCCLASLLSQSQGVTGKWSGTMSSHLKFRGALGEYDRWIDITITNNVAQGTVRQSGVMSINGKEICREQCSGSGPAELHEVSIYKSSNTYRVHAVSPVWTCTQSGSLCEYPEPHEMHPQDISPTDQPLQNPNFLSGSQTTVHDITPTDKVTITMSWSLIQGPLDAVLIVTPSNYNNWMPKATENELRKGTVIDIDMKLQSRNGGNSAFKVSRFELKLNNTSSEMGTTLNMPLDPPLQQLPDLRFLGHNIGESNEADQSMEVNSEDGRTGTATIGCYDGGAWTTLTVEAVLEGGFRVKGKLLTPTGPEEIPIPKRKPDSKIATAWLTQYGNLADTADREQITGNGHKGDGLTAYEEYRGVIAGGNYTKLKPTIKEVGLKAIIADYKIFDYGIKMFENATSLETVKFIPAEIPDDRRLNSNAGYANEHKQYALWMKIEVIREFDPQGNLRPVAGKAYGGPDIPEMIEKIVIDTNQIGPGYRELFASYQSVNAQLPFSKEDYWGTTIAHEIGHGVNVYHHGISKDVPTDVIAEENSTPPYFVRDVTGRLLRLPLDILGKIGRPGTQQSGDLSCFMAYNPCFDWALHDHRLSFEYYQVPLLSLGTKMCKITTGTSINAGGKYFGNAGPGRGNCIKQIKLK